MKQWMVFGLACVAVLTMLYAGVSALSNDHERSGMFLTFVAAMTVIGLVIDLINHVRAGRSM
jgi:hypothetical protein